MLGLYSYFIGRVFNNFTVQIYNKAGVPKLWTMAQRWTATQSRVGRRSNDIGCILGAPAIRYQVYLSLVINGVKEGGMDSDNRESVCTEWESLKWECSFQIPYLSNNVQRDPCNEMRAYARQIQGIMLDQIACWWGEVYKKHFSGTVAEISVMITEMSTMKQSSALWPRNITTAVSLVLVFAWFVTRSW